MAKKTLPAKAGEPNTAVDYRIKPGVAWVNGRAVGDAKTIGLTAAEAAYDLGLGRISLASKPEPADWKPEKADGGD